MSNRAYALAAIAFVVVLAGALAAGALWLGGYHARRQPYLVVSRIPVSGLAVDSPVLFRGIPVGSVREIRLDPANANLILIRIDVRAGLPIQRSTFAMMRLQGITGLAQIELENGSGVSQPLATDTRSPARIPLRPSLLDRLEANGEDTLRKLNVLVANLDLLTNQESIRQIRTILANVELASRKAVPLIADVRRVARGIEPLAQRARGTLGRVDRAVADVDRLTTSVRRLSDHATELAISGKRVTDMVANTTLPRANAALERAARAALALQLLSQDVRENPQSLLLGRPPVASGPGEPGYEQAGP